MPAYIALDDLDAGEPFMRTGFGFDEGAALHIGDFDGDGTDQILVAGSSLYELAWSGNGFRQVWTHPFALRGGQDVEIYDLTTADIDRDGRHEIFLSTESGMVRFDGASRRETVNSDPGIGQRCLDLEVADLNADDQYELVCLGTWQNRVISVLSAEDLGLIWQSPWLNGSRLSLSLGNVDNDAALEIVASNGHVYDGESFAEERGVEGEFGGSVVVLDIDGDRINEIAALTRDSLRVFGDQGQSLLWEEELNVGGRPVSVMTPVDVDGDSQYEIVAATASGFIALFKIGQEGIEKLSELEVMGLLDLYALDVWDADRDGEQEVLWRTRFGFQSGFEDAGVVGLTPGLKLEWTNLETYEVKPSFIGGGLARLYSAPPVAVFLGGSLATMSLESGKLSRLPDNSTRSPIWRPFAFRILDYDNDGSDEAVVVENLNQRHVTALDLASNQVDWTSPDGLVAESIEIGDFNNDGHEDLVIMESVDYTIRFHIYDLFGQALIFESESFPGSGRIHGVVKPPSGSGLDMIVGNSREITIYNVSNSGEMISKGKSRRIAAYDYMRVLDVAAADVDGNGSYEVFALLNGGYEGDSLVYLDEELNTIRSFELDSHATSLSLLDSGGSRKSILVATTPVEPFDVDDPGPFQFVAYDPDSGEKIWESPSMLGVVPKNSVHDVGTKPGTRLAFGTSVGMYVTP